MNSFPRQYTEGEAKLEASRCLSCSDPSCVEACPIGLNVQEFIREIATGNLTRSARILLGKNPFYWSCAYVCPVEQQCESECRYNEINYPVTIARLQQFVADEDRKQALFEFKFPGPSTKKVAIIGAGPAGLACAWQLALAGVKSTVFEKRAKIGGMLDWAVPAYRLPNEVRDQEFKRFENPLIDLKVNTPAPKVDDLLKEGFEAVFVATGLQDSANARLPGEEKANLALEFLERADQGELNCEGENVLVIGAGNVAMDVCGCAKRAGARKVEILCLESPCEMPACKKEIDEAVAEGVIFHNRFIPKEIVLEDGRVTGVRAVAIDWIEPDLFIPSNSQEIPGTECFIPASIVVEAIGQRPSNDLNDIFDGLNRERGLLTVNEDDMSTSVPGVYAGGDIVNGGSTVARAVDHGNRAAASILTQLGIELRKSS